MLLEHLRFLFLASALQCREAVRSGLYLGLVFSVIPIVISLSWIVGQGQDATKVTFITVGAFFLFLWYNATFQMGSIVRSEAAQGTLSLNLMSHTPLILIMFVKAVGFAILGGTAGCIGVAIVLALNGASVSVNNPWLAVLSGLTTFVTVIVGAFALAPLLVLLRGRPGFFNAITPLGIVLSGLFFPIASLPLFLRLPAYAWPPAWATQSTFDSITGNASTSAIVIQLILAVAITVLYVAAIAYLFNRVERRLQATGNLDAI